MVIINTENRVWVRITNSCNCKCTFCLDQITLNRKISNIDEKIVLKNIKDWFKKNYNNKIIISWWEASINPKFFEYLNYAKNIWYSKIQTITNWIKWWSFEFCKKAVENWLNEITFSIHWHNQIVHDSLTWIKWSFNNIIKAIFYFKNYFSRIIVNTDIVICKENIENIHKLIVLLKKLWVYEYDILQVVPFASARENKERILFENIYDFKYNFAKIFEHSKDKKVHMRANRIFPRLLDWYENLIQNVEKIEDEILWEASKSREEDFKNKKSHFCYEKFRCNNCYLTFFCESLKLFFKDEPAKTIVKNQKKQKEFKLESNRSITIIQQKYPSNIEKFINNIKVESKKYDWVINIPFCIVKKNNKFETYNQFNKKNKKWLKSYIERFMDEWFRIKWDNCEKCLFFQKCQWVHINFIKHYWFKLLKPILNQDKKNE